MPPKHSIYRTIEPSVTLTISGGGAQGAWGPPLEIEKQKKKKKKKRSSEQILSYFTLILLLF